MTILLYIVIFPPLAFIAIQRLRKIAATGDLNISDGLLFGGWYFLFLPFLCALIFGSIGSPPELRFDSFVPAENVETSLYIWFSLFCFTILSMALTPIVYGEEPEATNKAIHRNCWRALVATYLCSTLTMFVLSGKYLGYSHWYMSNAALLGSGGFYGFIGQFANVTRILIPAFILYAGINRAIWPKRNVILPMILTAGGLTLIDLILTGNRITILFFGLALIGVIIFRAWWRLAMVAAVLLPLVLLISLYWPIVRGMLWSERLSVDHVENIYNSVNAERSYKNAYSGDNAIADVIVATTEGFNLVVLNYIVDAYPGRYSCTYGSTMIMKTMLTPIPKYYIPWKPNSIGTDIGSRVSGNPYLVLNTTIIGEAWANFWWLGVPLLCIFVYGISRLFNAPLPRRLISCMGAFLAFASWRFDFSFLVLSLVVVWLIATLVKLVSNPALRQSSAKPTGSLRDG